MVELEAYGSLCINNPSLSIVTMVSYKINNILTFHIIITVKKYKGYRSLFSSSWLYNREKRGLHRHYVPVNPR